MGLHISCLMSCTADMLCVKPGSNSVVVYNIHIHKFMQCIDHAMFHVVLWCHICWMLVIVFCIVYLGLSPMYKVLAIILACLCHLCLLCSFALYAWVHHPCIWSLHSAIVLLCACLNLCLFKVVPVSSDHYKLFHNFANAFLWFDILTFAILLFDILIAIILFAISYVQEMASGFHTLHISNTSLKVVSFSLLSRGDVIWFDLKCFWSVSINLDIKTQCVCLPLRRSQSSKLIRYIGAQ